MPVTQFIAHKIQKESKDIAASINFCDASSEVTDFTQSMMSQLKSVFTQRAGKRYGRFDVENSAFKALIQNWQRDQQPFSSLTKSLTKMYQEKLDSTQLEVEGYLVFLTEQLVDEDRFYVFLVREKSNVALDENMQLVKNQYIDFSNTGFALNINTSLLKDEGKELYLTFAFGRGEKAAQHAFCDACGFTDTINTEEETKEFLQIVDDYTESLPEEKAVETRTKILDYCIEQDKHGEKVEFDVLSRELDDDAPRKFQEFIVQKHQARRMDQSIEAAGSPETEKTELIPDRKSLKNYIRFSGKNKDVTLSFAATALGSDVEFDAGRDQLVIKNLPAKLLKQLKHS